jgi:hypothetical protein
MISWLQICYGAALSGLLAGIALALPGRLPVALAGAVATAAGAVAWNAILHTAHGDQFFTDAPLVVLPASWQDTGSGVFTLALVGLVLAAGVLPAAPARRVAAYAGVCGMVAFLVDVYLY